MAPQNPAAAPGTDEVAKWAAECAAHLDPAAGSFADNASRFATQLAHLLEAVRRLGDRFSYDHEGRPAAISAIRVALPAVERDILDAVLDDHACELAATQEAFYQIALAYAARLDGLHRV